MLEQNQIATLQRAHGVLRRLSEEMWVPARLRADAKEEVGNLERMFPEALSRRGIFCTECGTRCRVVNDGFYVCYQCTECDTHFVYMDGAYHIGEDGDGCPNCDAQEDEAA